MFPSSSSSPAARSSSSSLKPTTRPRSRPAISRQSSNSANWRSRVSPDMEAVDRPALDHHAAVFVAGADTLIGSALLRRLRAQGFSRIVGAPPDEPDLTNRQRLDQFFADEAP